MGKKKREEKKKIIEKNCCVKTKKKTKEGRGTGQYGNITDPSEGIGTGRAKMMIR